ncbi:MAG: UDP-N-acetylmuramate dehydrogenase [Achromobacter pulmonis]|uniref:UDP-N-acetylenolpyruvoylglucosamine reductase n=1 Tax=Achromobacter pulmonis TaxID=1389932 RepID=A0A6S7CX22_9BURK|nr:UDP-N-acetylmuramate dehydrogenase [Achromobacter pulmonis]CAB3625084.1 UDP-N-acetylenolpyruvoylglucosamine reductase [Achromobacter pulmonis]CAB3867893.1 UDP-N-acetylenolpyruvoylglucosamine reductase [Achromobacter pulmonis]
MSNSSTSTPALIPTTRDLSVLNTLGLAATARACVTLEDVAQLPGLSALAAQYEPLLVLGGGSNVVLPESVPGLVARVALRGVRLLRAEAGAWLVEAAGGETWHGFVAECVKQGWDGLENLALIPGTVGAAPVQNIGAYGVELADRFDSLTAWDVQAGRYVDMSAADCRFAYRDSVFKHQPPGRWVIVAVRLRLPRPWRPVLSYPDLQRYPGLAGEPSARAIFEAVCEIRRAKLPDPAVTGNAGSFFKNPIVSAARRDALAALHPGLVSYPQPDGSYKLAAGWLIDQCGWKGRSLGAAGVHERQALVLVNRGGATAADILALARAIQDSVAERYGVALEPEPVMV